MHKSTELMVYNNKLYNVHEKSLSSDQLQRRAAFI